jgi:hypothetical protein
VEGGPYAELLAVGVVEGAEGDGAAKAVEAVAVRVSAKAILFIFIIKSLWVVSF